jgi:hypothetical protein
MFSIILITIVLDEVFQTIEKEFDRNELFELHNLLYVFYLANFSASLPFCLNPNIRSIQLFIYLDTSSLYKICLICNTK